MKKNRLVLVMILVVVFFVLTLNIVTSTVAASGYEHKKDKLVTSVLIEEGDSLWSIAVAYYTDECETMEAYIKEIKRSNGIYSDVIYSGQYIIVPYYQ